MGVSPELLILWRLGKSRRGCTSLLRLERELPTDTHGEMRVNRHWVMLTGPEELLTARLNARKGHFFDASLLRSQLQTLELPKYGWTIEVEPSPELIINVLLDRFAKL